MLAKYYSQKKFFLEFEFFHLPTTLKPIIVRESGEQQTVVEHQPNMNNRRQQDLWKQQSLVLVAEKWGTS